MSNHYNYILNFAILEGILYCKCSRWLGKVTKSPLLFLSALTQSNLCHSGRSQDIQKVEALEALYDTITDFSPFGTLSKSISGSSPYKSNIHFLHKPLASFRSLCWTSRPQLRHSGRAYRRLSGRIRPALHVNNITFIQKQCQIQFMSYAIKYTSSVWQTQNPLYQVQS